MAWTRRSVALYAVVVVALLAALPAAIHRIVQTGNPYLFTRQFFEDIFARLSDAGRLRFIFQPVVAILLGRRDGLNDARIGLPPFLRSFISHREHATERIRNALASVRDLVAVAILMDMISQFLIFRRVHPGAALLIGPVLIAFPYASARTIANLISQRRTGRMLVRRVG